MITKLRATIKHSERGIAPLILLMIIGGLLATAGAVIFLTRETPAEIITPAQVKPELPGGTFVTGDGILTFRGSDENFGTLELNLSKNGQVFRLASDIPAGQGSWQFIATSHPNIIVLAGRQPATDGEQTGWQNYSIYINVQTEKILSIEQADLSELIVSKADGSQTIIYVKPSETQPATQTNPNLTPGATPAPVTGLVVNGVSQDLNKVFLGVDIADTGTTVIVTPANGGSSEITLDTSGASPEGSANSETSTIGITLDTETETISPTSSADETEIVVAGPVPPQMPPASGGNGGESENPPISGTGENLSEIDTSPWINYSSAAFGFALRHPPGWIFNDLIPLNLAVPTKQLVLVEPTAVSEAGSRVSLSIHDVTGPFPYEEYAANFFAPSPYLITQTSVSGQTTTLIEYYELGTTRITIFNQGNIYAAMLLVPGNQLTVEVYNAVLQTFHFTP